MATLLKSQKSNFGFLEEVRKHLSRLPAIDPNTRTLILTGYPNVGKSSFMNNITRANVDVQPYAFTTKSLFVGHMDYKYLRWQVRLCVCAFVRASRHVGVAACRALVACVRVRWRWRLRLQRHNQVLHCIVHAFLLFSGLLPPLPALTPSSHR